MRINGLVDLTVAYGLYVVIQPLIDFWKSAFDILFSQAETDRLLKPFEIAL